jgi:hypothetical protein
VSVTNGEGCRTDLSAAVGVFPHPAVDESVLMSWSASLDSEAVPLLGQADTFNTVDHDFHFLAIRTFARRVDDFVSCEPDSPKFSLVLRPDVTFRSE